jgi:hypothetical protein
VNRIDPSGNFTLVDVLTTAFVIVNLASRIYVAASIGYLIGTAIRFTYDEELTLDELVDQSLKVTISLAGGYAIGKGVGWAFAKWIGPLARKLTPIVWQRCGQLGKAAEEYAFALNGVFRNSKTLAELGGSGEYIPDAITQTVLHEVKNVGRLPLETQIKAFAAFCAQTGRKFVIHVRPGSKIDSTVVRELEKQFGAAQRGTKWDIVADVPEDMRITTQLAK